MIMIPKVLKRKDALSVVVAIVLGMILVQVFQMWSMPLTSEIVSSSYGYSAPGWKEAYLSPAISGLLSLAFLEAALWAWVAINGSMKSK